MQIYSTNVQPPKTPQDFEDACHLIYSVVFDDPTATKYGRSGQQQHGVDVFAVHKGRRYGIQCKQKTFGKLTEKIIAEEVDAADSGPIKIYELVIATTAPNDAKLVTYVANLTDSRTEAEKFRVSIAFWDTLESLIRRYPELQANFAPHMLGGLVYDQARRFDKQETLLEGIANGLSAGTFRNDLPTPSIPDARADSLNKLVDKQLDGIKQLLTNGKFTNALVSLTTLGHSLEAFDVHQQGRWYTQRAHCYWNQGALEFAADDFDRAYELTPDDDKAVGNQIRGQLLRSRFDDAFTLADAARKRFPSSPGVLAAWLQAADRTGKPLKWARDVPPEFRKTRDILHVFGWLRVFAGDYKEAAHYAKLACDDGEANFDNWALLLLALVNDVGADGALASLGVVPLAVVEELRLAIGLFEPVAETLWSRQESLSTVQAATSLGYAYLMTGNVPAAKALLVEAVQRLPSDPQLTRVCLESIMRSDNQSASFEFGSAHLESLDDEGKLIVAEIAGHRGDVAVIARARESLTSSDGVCIYEPELRAFSWLARSNSGARDALAKDLTLEKLEAEVSIPARVIGTMVAYRQGFDWAVSAAQSLAAQITKDSPIRDVLMAARACAALEQYPLVVSLLQDRLPAGFMSEPHKQLFEALIRTGARKRAQKMLLEFPESAMDDAEARSLAVELAQEANDWSELSRLAELQLKANRGSSHAWVFQAVVMLRQKRIVDAQHLLHSDIPLALNGDFRSQGQLAKLEIDFGARERGFNRLYQMFRSALTDGEAASAYLSHFLFLAPELIPEAPQSVAAGTAVTLAAADGERRTVVIDPDGIPNLPKAASFESSAGKLYGILAGKRPGESVQIEDGFGAAHEYLIVAIDSAQRFLVGRAREMSHQSIIPSGPLLSLAIPTDKDGQMDLSNLLSMLKARSEQVREAFSAYAKGPVTLGILGQLLGGSATAVASDWPQGLDAKLYVCNGTHQERAEAHELLQSWSKPLVIDLTALNELVANGLEMTLLLFHPVFISTSAVATLDQLVASAVSDRSKGHMREVNGRINMVEYDDEYHESQRTYAERLQACVEQYCEVVPAWGIENPPEHFVEIGGLLDVESFDAMQLCLEKDALLLTVDGRLREIAKAMAGIPGVWPQIYCAFATERNLCTADTYSRFALMSVAKRRAHTTVGMTEIIWAIRQPKAVQVEAMKNLRLLFGDLNIEKRSAVQVITEALQHVITNGATPPAACRLVEALLAPMFCRSDIEPDELQAFMQFRLCEFVLGYFNVNLLRPLTSTPYVTRRDLWVRALAGAIQKARMLAAEFSLSELAEIPVDVAPLYGLRKPLLLAKPATP
jgi:tetratricopeptide (TPR) repeat protein